MAGQRRGGGRAVSGPPRVDACANPKCKAPFRSLSKGELFVFAVRDPVAWGLPEHAKQKAVWLCEECRRLMLVRLDHRLRQVRLVRKGTQEQKPATLLEGRPARLNSA